MNTREVYQVYTYIFTSSNISAHIQAACEELMGRLEPFMKENPAAGWDAWV